MEICLIFLLNRWVKIKVMSKGQVTIPKDVRDVLGVTNSDRITFVVENGSVHIFNSAVYAMNMLIDTKYTHFTKKYIGSISPFMEPIYKL